MKPDGSVTAGNASGVNDGSCALLVASEAAATKHGLTPRARIVGAATAGVPPRIMGIGPAPATQKLLARTGLKIGDIDVIELNEAFAAQALAVTRMLGLPDDAAHVNPNGGAIALGHPARRVRRAARDDRALPARAHRRALRAARRCASASGRASRSSSSGSSARHPRRRTATLARSRRSRRVSED